MRGKSLAGGPVKGIRQAMRTLLEACRKLEACLKDSYATCGQELEIGVRWIAVPILDKRAISERAERYGGGLEHPAARIA